MAQTATLSGPAIDPEEILDRVRHVIAEHLGLGIERVVPEAHIGRDLGADSLDLIELALGIEEEFDVELPDPEAEAGLTTVEGAAELVHRFV